MPVTSSFHRGRRLCFAAAVAASLLPGAAYAVTFEVTSDGDAPDVLPGDGYCRDEGGACTLRAAVEEANASPGPDLVSLEWRTVTTDGGFTLTESVEVAWGTVIANPSDERVFTVDQDPSLPEGEEFTFTSLEVFGQYGMPSGGGFRVAGDSGEALTLVECWIDNFAVAGDGAGLWSSGERTLTLEDVTFNHSQADGDGGAIYLEEGDLTVTGGEFQMGVASRGGAIAIAGGIVELTDTLFQGNEAWEGGGALAIVEADDVAAVTLSGVRGTINGTLGWGGFFDDGGAAGAGHITRVDRSVLDNNTAFEGGGALSLRSPRGVLLMSSSTLGRNDAARGGAVHVSDTSWLALESTTVAFNTATGDVRSGGLAVEGAATVSMRGVLLALNGTGSYTSDCSGRVLSGGGNVVTRTGGAAGSSCQGFGGSDRIGTRAHPLNAKLSADLVGLDGESPTFALKAGSAAIDNGGAACPETDQDGYFRVDGDLDGVVECDAGSFEWGAR
ncbi:hypothetical protein L6R50_27915 [Myxococcota bacterium]|nr:hypothetical protein [Myxococcota bacterium]